MGRLEPVNMNQKSPSDSGANHPTGNSCNPLLGHATSHAATLIGLFAIVLWGFMAGLVRLVSESFGATLGSALIYTVGGVMLFIVRRPKPIREAPCKYLIAGGLMFIAYEASISLSIGLATTNAQSVEVSLVNYLWPTLLVLMTAAVSHKRGAVAKAIPGAVIATIGVAMAVAEKALICRKRSTISPVTPYRMCSRLLAPLFGRFMRLLRRRCPAVTTARRFSSAVWPLYCGPSISFRETVCRTRRPASVDMLR